MVIIETLGLGDRSYLISSGDVAVVVDPQRDIDRLLTAAADRHVRITHVLERHIHNDYLSGGLELARVTGADYIVAAAEDVGFPGHTRRRCADRRRVRQRQGSRDQRRAAVSRSTTGAPVISSMSPKGARTSCGRALEGEDREAAIDILDAEGETALTFRALTARLTTGSGAIYWHVANKNELLGVPEPAQIDSASVLVNYILGVAGQNAANARLLLRDTDRAAFLAAVAAQWTTRDPADFPFAHQVASQLRDHDDREQSLAGIDLILAGITAVR